jgi:hypothetical protein
MLDCNLIVRRKYSETMPKFNWQNIKKVGVSWCFRKLFCLVWSNLVWFGSVRFALGWIISVRFGSVYFYLKKLDLGSVRFGFLHSVWTEKSVRFGRTAWPYTWHSFDQSITWIYFSFKKTNFSDQSIVMPLEVKKVMLKKSRLGFKSQLFSN